MTTYFIDLDGVFFKHGTLIPTKNSIKTINQLANAGNKIIFTTKRKYKNNNDPRVNLYKTKAVLKKLNVKYHSIIGDLDSPRVLINDEGSIAINHEKNDPLIIENIKKVESKYENKKELINRTYNILAGLAWTNFITEDGQEGIDGSNDFDDYQQSIAIANYLIKNENVDDASLLRYLRAYCRNIKGSTQWNKMMNSPEMLYNSKDGITCGAAMRVSCIAPFFLNNFEECIKSTICISRITHGTVEAQLSAVLISLRVRQILSNTNSSDIDQLLDDFNRAIDLLNLRKKSQFFLSIVETAVNITKKENNSIRLIKKLINNIGIAHLSWSAPVSACFWSYRANNNYTHLINKKIYGINNRSTYLKPSICKKYWEHLRKANHYREYFRRYGQRCGDNKIDADYDTFLSIAISLFAGVKGIECIKSEMPNTINFFKDDLKKIARCLNGRKN